MFSLFILFFLQIGVFFSTMHSHSFCQKILLRLLKLQSIFSVWCSKGTCCVFFILCKNRHGRIHQLLKSLSSLKTFYLFFPLYVFTVSEFEQHLISLCLNFLLEKERTGICICWRNTFKERNYSSSIYVQWILNNTATYLKNKTKAPNQPKNKQTKNLANQGLQEASEEYGNYTEM